MAAHENDSRSSSLPHRHPFDDPGTLNAVVERFLRVPFVKKDRADTIAPIFSIAPIPARRRPRILKLSRRFLLTEIRPAHRETLDLRAEGLVY